MNATASQPDIRDQLLLRLAESRSITDELFRIVRTDALYDRPIPERHRIVFYIGHLEAFDWNLIAGHALGLGAAHKELDRLFAFGIDPVDGGLPRDSPSDWPRLSEISAYNLRVREGIDDILKSHSQASASHWQYPREVILNVAIEHRLMHAETLAYMLHQLTSGSEDSAARLSTRGHSVQTANRFPDDRYSRRDLPRWGFRALEMCLAGTTSLKSIPSKCRPSRLAPTRLRTGSFSGSCAKADTTIAGSGAPRTGPGSISRGSPIRICGSIARTSGFIGRCLKRLSYRSTGRYMSVTQRPRPLRVSLANPFPPKRNFIARLMERRKALKRWSGRIRGAMRPPMLAAAILTSSVGIPSRWGVIPTGGAPSGWRNLSATAGNGPPLPLRPTQAFSRFPFTAVTRLTSLTESISSSKALRRALRRRCCGVRSATGSSRIIRLFTHLSAV